MKPEEMRSSNSFAELFGPPIKTAKLSPTPKPVVKSSESSKHSSDKQVSN